MGGGTKSFDVSLAGWDVGPVKELKGLCLALGFRVCVQYYEEVPVPVLDDLVNVNVRSFLLVTRAILPGEGFRYRVWSSGLAMWMRG